MNLQEIRQAAFEDEMQKIATSESKAAKVIVRALGKNMSNTKSEFHLAKNLKDVEKIQNLFGTQGPGALSNMGSSFNLNNKTVWGSTFPGQRDKVIESIAILKNTRNYLRK